MPETIPASVFVIAVIANSHCDGLFGWSRDEADARADFTTEAAPDASGEHHEVRLLRVDIPEDVRGDMARVLARDPVEVVENLIASYLDWVGVNLPDHDPANDGALLASHTPTGWN